MSGDSGYFDQAASDAADLRHAQWMASRGDTSMLEAINNFNANQAAQAQAAIQETQAAAAQAQARADSLIGTPIYEAVQNMADDLRNQVIVQQFQQEYKQNPQAFVGATAEPRTISTEGLIPTNVDWRGTPTLYTDASGAVKGIYTSIGVVPVESLNVLSGGKPITANTLVQATNEDGQKLYLSDPNDPNSRTTRNTGIPAIGGTVAEQAFYMPKNNSPLGTIGSDFAGMAKDPAFWKFLASAAALGTGAYLAPALEGAGAVATAFPVEMGGLLPATELGAVGTAAGAAGGMSAAEALAAASQGGLGAEFGVQGALGGSGGGLGALFGGLGSSSLLQGGLALGGLAALNALAPKQGSTGGGSAPAGLSSEQLKAIVSTMPSAMGNYMSMAGNPYGYGGGTIDSANVNLANLFPNYSLPTTGPFYGAGRFGDAYAPVAASTTPISPTGLV